MTARKTVMLTSPNLGFIEDTLSTRYEVLRSWEVLSNDALARVGALVCLGHQSPSVLLDRLPSLGLVACYTTGYDGIDLVEIERRGLLVSHAPGATAHAVAEFALAQILAMFRNVVSGERLVRSGQWRKDTVTPIGRSISRSRFGIIGLGAIGQALAEMIEALGGSVAWWGPRPKPAARWTYAASLIELATLSDVLVVCARADSANRGLVSREVIDALGHDGLLVNVARGQLVDEEALIASLRERRLGGAALDVFESEPTPISRWEGVPNVLLTPHLGGASTESTRVMTAMLMENLQRFFAGDELAHPIHLASVKG